MHYLRYFSAFFLLVTALSSAKAADINGYSAKYEKAVPTPPACDVVIDSAGDGDWSKLNDPSYSVICLRPGDYASRGKLVLRAAGSSARKRWLRHYNAGVEPWKQSTSERAKVAGLVLEGAAHWIIQGIAVDPDYTDSGDGTIQFSRATNVNNVIIDSVLVENGASANLVYLGWDVHDNSIQNSVLRDCRIRTRVDPGGIGIFGAQNNSIVNNEIYGCVKAIYISEARAPGHIIENNDLYVPSKLYSDCNGNYNGSGPCAATESIIGTKNGGNASQPVIFIHNRIWGNRPTDLNLCCVGGGQGDLAFIGGKDASADPNTTGAKYTLFMNNILMDGQTAIGSYWSGTRNNSFIGNLIYNIRRHYSKYPSNAIFTGHGVSSEFYLNSIVGAHSWMNLGGSQNDVRCNVAIDSGSGSLSPGSGTQVENNVFYNTTPYATASGAYLSRASASDAASGEFCFYRRLRTGPERFCIPQAKPSTGSPHYQSCQADLGSRPGIGINDAFPLY